MAATVPAGDRSADALIGEGSVEDNLGKTAPAILSANDDDNYKVESNGAPPNVLSARRASRLAETEKEYEAAMMEHKRLQAAQMRKRGIVDEHAVFFSPDIETKRQGGL